MRRTFPKIYFPKFSQTKKQRENIFQKLTTVEARLNNIEYLIQHNAYISLFSLNCIDGA